MDLTKIIDSRPLCHGGFDPLERATDRCFARRVLGRTEEGVLDEERDVARKRLLEVAHQLFDVTTSGVKVINYCLCIQ